MKRALQLLSKSRKFWLAVGDILLVILVQNIGLDPALADSIVKAALLLGMSVIAGIAIEDAARKLGITDKEED